MAERGTGATRYDDSPVGSPYMVVVAKDEDVLAKECRRALAVGQKAEEKRRKFWEKYCATKSGYFPFTKHNSGYYELLDAAKVVEQVADDYLSLIRELNQTDNAARDSIYIGYLEAAAELIRKCLREEA